MRFNAAPRCSLLPVAAACVLAVMLSAPTEAQASGQPTIIAISARLDAGELRISGRNFSLTPLPRVRFGTEGSGFIELAVNRWRRLHVSVKPRRRRVIRDSII